MESLSTRISELRDIATKLNLYGESVELLIQLLGYSLQVSEVEHVAYSQEASLERATLMNSKIQHCVERLYSVFRGENPRVIINLQADKYFQFNPYDEIMSSNNYKAYYLGYWSEDSKEFKYSGTSIYPGASKIIIGFISSEKITTRWTVDKSNVFFKDIIDDNGSSDLSSDGYLKMSNEENGLRDINSRVNITRDFPEHDAKNYFFDLTLPGWSQRFYYPPKYENNGIDTREDYINKWFEAVSFKFLTISSINRNELKNFKIGGSTLIDFPEEFLNDNPNIKKYKDSTDSYSFGGVIFVPEVSRENMENIHYLANKNRYTGTLLATNSDLSYLLYNQFPNKVRPGGTTYKYENDTLTLYYIPSGVSLITQSEKKKFREENKAYYISNNLDIDKGVLYRVKLNVVVELYKNATLSSKITELIQDYTYRFNINLGDNETQTKLFQEIKSLITKISEVKYVSSIDFVYTDPENKVVKYKDLLTDSSSPEGGFKEAIYFDISCNINSTLS